MQFDPGTAFEDLEALVEERERYYMQTVPPDDEVEPAATAFDPGEHTVADATVWAASATDDEIGAAILAEEAGKARVTLLDAFNAELARRAPQ